MLHTGMSASIRLCLFAAPGVKLGCQLRPGTTLCQPDRMEILTTANAWQRLARISDAEGRVTAWTREYEAGFPTVFDVYYSAWGDRGRRRDAALRAPELTQRIRAAESRARVLLREAEDDFRDRGLLCEDDLHAVLLVGGHTSNGWVAEHAGQRTLFLALEFLGHPPHDDLLVVHELTHVAQAQLSVATRAQTYPASLAVVVEGVATATTRVVRPGLTDSAYLWMDEGHHQWVDRCRASAPKIATMLLEHLDTPDDADAVAPLFRNVTDQHVPARSAYWAGDQIAQDMLQQGYALRDLLSIAEDDARTWVATWAAAHLRTSG